MSYTLQVSDGMVVLDPATGSLKTVTGNRKCSQDMAEVLLQTYDPNQDYGSYLNAVIQNKIPYTSQLLIRNYVAAAVDLLMQKQLQDPFITADEQIDSITNLVTADDNEGTVGFYVSVSTLSGATAEASAVQATSLKQLTENF
jgi:hypothetical protein